MKIERRATAPRRQMDLGRLLLAITVISSPFQIYTWAIAEIYLPLTLIAGLSLFAFYNVEISARISKPMQALICLFLVQVISFLWAVNMKDGLKELAFTVPFVAIFSGALKEGKRDPRFLLNLITIYAVVQLVQCIFVIYFRVNPDAKLNYLQGGLANILSNPSRVQGLSGPFRDNISSPDKSGGFELNANAGACWMGMTAMIAYGVGMAFKKRLLCAVAIINLVAIPFSGSKAASAIAVVLFVGMHVIVFLKNRPSRAKGIFVTVVGMIICAIFVVLINFFADFAFFKDSSDTLDVRGLIWAHAASEFLRVPFLGLGFGGWAGSYQPYAWQQGIGDTYPPHNTLIALWSESGIFAAVFACAFVVGVTMDVTRMLRSGSVVAIWLAVGFWCGYLFVFIQGLGENWGLLGTLRMSPILALTYALLQLIGYWVTQNPTETRATIYGVRHA
jgi:O-antigen ligase